MEQQRIGYESEITHTSPRWIKLEETLSSFPSSVLRLVREFDAVCSIQTCIEKHQIVPLHLLIPEVFDPHKHQDQVIQTGQGQNPDIYFYDSSTNLYVSWAHLQSFIVRELQFHGIHLPLELMPMGISPPSRNVPYVSLRATLNYIPCRGNRLFSCLTLQFSDRRAYSFATTEFELKENVPLSETVRQCLNLLAPHVPIDDITIVETDHELDKYERRRALKDRKWIFILDTVHRKLVYTSNDVQYNQYGIAKVFCAACNGHHENTYSCDYTWTVVPFVATPLNNRVTDGMEDFGCWIRKHEHVIWRIIGIVAVLALLVGMVLRLLGVLPIS